MSKIDYSTLDGRALRTFLTVLEEMSVSKAAEQLGVTQSAVSHTLDKLRVAFGDPLFVRSGRGIHPTERASALREPVQSVLDDLKALADERQFDPKHEPMEYTVAANDLTRVLLFPPLLREFDESGIDVTLRFMPSGIPGATMLREARCQMIVTPVPPQGADIVQQVLFRNPLMCFYDSNMRDAPGTWDEYVESEYVDVGFPDKSSALDVVEGIDVTKLKAPKVTVPAFGDVPAFIKGTRRITTQLDIQHLWPLNELARCELPFDTSPLSICLVWHRRDHTDPAHKWLRGEIKGVSGRLVGIR